MSSNFEFELKGIQAEVMQQIGDDNDATLADLWGRVLQSFEQWKQENGDRKPRATSLSGLLGKPIPFKKATPWQCADFKYPSPVALAVKLWREDYKPFMQIMKQEVARKVLAMLIVRFGKDSNEIDVRDAHRILSAHQVLETGINEGMNIASLRQAMNLDKGRAKGVLARQKKAEKKKSDLINAIKALFDKPEKPGWGWTNDEIVVFLMRSDYSYAASSVLSVVKREAAKYSKTRKEEQASKYPNR